MGKTLILGRCMDRFFEQKMWPASNYSGKNLENTVVLRVIMRKT